MRDKVAGLHKRSSWAKEKVRTSRHWGAEKSKCDKNDIGHYIFVERCASGYVVDCFGFFCSTCMDTCTHRAKLLQVYHNHTYHDCGENPLNTLNWKDTACLGGDSLPHTIVMPTNYCDAYRPTSTYRWSSKLINSGWECILNNLARAAV